MSQITILGTRIDPLTMKAAAELICDRARSDEPASYVTKPYVEFLDRAASDADLRVLLNDSWLSLPDSIAVQWAAWYLDKGQGSIASLASSLMRIVSRPHTLKNPVPERFAGVDFAWIMLEQAATTKTRIYLVGHPKNSSIDRTVESIRHRLPDIDIVGTFDGYAVNHLEADLVADLRTKKPDLILVGIGFPRQERLMSRLVDAVEHGVFIGEGGTFDYASFGGRVRRAPAWMRQIGLEWLWRLIIDPRRLRRQVSIPRFIWKVYRAKKDQ